MHRAAVVLVIEFTAALGWWWPAAAVAWDTDRLYGTPTRARLTDVVVWRNRAYACWPRADASQPVTLLELPWPETADGQASSSWTPRRPFYADQQIQSVELGGLNGSRLATLVVDARPFKGETRVYVGDALGGRIAVLDPDRNIWYMIALLHIQNYGSAVIQDYRRPEIYPDVPAECIAVSKLQSSVYLTSKRSHDLYTASFKDLRNLTSYVTPNVKNGDVLPVGLRVRWEGVKLGVSSGLYADIQGGLNYVYTRDFVAVRLSLIAGAAPVAAEDHKVLLQSYDLLPAVTKIFSDNANYLQVWALNAVPNSKNRHLVKINTLTL
ncbi:uncharacterized protein LOC132929946 isoform X3 [Rhopalosiphum padi]|uniref:uncharacterized protein LOC132929946 isoform X3 n=1 Tax=Rhopalosiphum padi TaxID=40932 RepID=UPI00298DFA11|nr:uncharacterized protein LOC132929946 isoform X3 [Rhopalosiphum padi]